MEKTKNPLLQKTWAQVLATWTSEDLAAAFSYVAQTSKGWPTIGDLTGFILERRWAYSLMWLLGSLRHHWRGGKWVARPAVYGDPWRKPGARMDEWEPGLMIESEIPAPEIPPELKRALEIYGGGRLEDGLRELSKHPAVGAIDWNAEEASRMKAQIEKGFHAAWMIAQQIEMSR